MTRLRCVVPSCRRTRGQRKGEPPIKGDEEWICGVHWKMVDRSLKALRRQSRRRWDRRVAIAEFAKKQAEETFYADMRSRDDGTFRQELYLAWRRCDEALNRAQWARWRAWYGIWRRMKRQAIERACGI